MTIIGWILCIFILSWLFETGTSCDTYKRWVRLLRLNNILVLLCQIRQVSLNSTWYSSGDPDHFKTLITGFYILPFVFSLFSFYIFINYDSVQSVKISFISVLCLCQHLFHQYSVPILSKNYQHRYTTEMTLPVWCSVT